MCVVIINGIVFLSRTSAEPLYSAEKVRFCTVEFISLLTLTLTLLKVNAFPTFIRAAMFEEVHMKFLAFSGAYNLANLTRVAQTVAFVCFVQMPCGWQTGDDVSY